MKKITKVMASSMRNCYKNSKEFVEALEAVEAVAFSSDFKQEYAERFVESFTKSIVHYLNEALTNGKGEAASVTLPHGTFTSEDAGDVINISLEFSKSAQEFAAGEVDRLRRMDASEYDAEFIKLFRTWVAYDGPVEVDHSSGKTWGITLPDDDAAALILQDISATIMHELQKYAKEGSVSTLEIEKHGKYSLELNDGQAELSFEANKVSKQKGKND